MLRIVNLGYFANKKYKYKAKMNKSYDKQVQKEIWAKIKENSSFQIPEIHELTEMDEFKTFEANNKMLDTDPIIAENNKGGQELFYYLYKI